MTKNILKYFGFAAFLAFGANAEAETINVAVQDELEGAIKSANAGDTIKLAAGTFTTYGAEYAQGKTLTFEGTTDGDGALLTTWNYGSVNIVNGEGGSDYSFEGSVVSFTNVKFHDNCNNGGAGYRGFVRLGGGSFTGCTFDTLLVYLGSGTVTFKECVFNMPDYCFWAYGIRSLNFDNCTFNSTAGKFINAYIEKQQAFDIGINIKDCTFNGGAVKYPAVKVKNDNNYILAFTGTQTFNNVGTGSPTGSQYFDIQAGVKAGTTITIGGAKVWENGQAVDPTPAYDPTKWSGATYEAFATKPETVETANKFIADLPAVVKDYIAVDAANKAVTLSSADAFAFITYLPNYLAALCVLDCAEKGYGDPRLSAYWVGAEHHSWTVTITTDIDLQNQDWKPVTSGYSYLVDFKNHTISNLKATGLTTNGGLFGDLYYAQNVTIDGAEVATTADNAGVLAGALSGFAKNVTVKNAMLAGGKYTGAIGGYVYGDIEGCKVVGTGSAPVVITSATKEVGAVAGLFAASSIKNCEVAFVSVTGQEEVGGIAGRVLDGDVKEHAIVDCTVADVTLKATKNGDATVDPGVVGGSAANYVGLISGRDYHETLTITSGGEQVYPVVVKNFYQDETNKSLWHIANVAGLKEFGAAVKGGSNFAGQTVVLDDDMDMSGVTDWEPISHVAGHTDSSFGGVFDGQNHVISNFTVQGNGGFGFFATLQGPVTIKNLTFDHASVTGSEADKGNMVGIVVAYAYMEATFENITIKDSNVWAFGKVGAIVGMAADPQRTTTFRNCKIENTTVKGAYNCGGLCGLAQNEVVVENCDVDGATFVVGGRYPESDYVDLVTTATCGDKTINVGGKFWKYNATFYFAAWDSECCYYPTQAELEWTLEGTSIAIDANCLAASSVETPAEIEVEEPNLDEAKENAKVVDAAGEIVEIKEEVKAKVEAVVEKVVADMKNNNAVKTFEDTGVVEAVMTEGTEPEKVVVKPVVVEALVAAAKTAGVEDAAEQINENSAVKSYVKIVLDETKVAVADPASVDTAVSLKAVAFEVTPMVEVVVSKTVGETTTETKVVEQMPQNVIDANKGITFCLPVADETAMSAIVTHKGGKDEVFTLPVQGAIGGRYVQVTANHFSIFIVEPTGTVIVDSDETLGIVKVSKDQLVDGEVAVGVPFVKSPAGAEQTVDTLLVAGFGGDDTIRVWNPDKSSKSDYDSWYWDEDFKEWLAIKSDTGDIPADASEAEVVRGKAFWFNDFSKSAIDLALAGLVKANVQTTVAVGSSSAPKMTLLVNPFGEDIDIVTKLATGPATGDQIVFVNGKTRYEFKEGSGWGTWTTVEKTIGKITIKNDVFKPAEKIIVTGGTSFWYVSRGGQPTISWDSDK